MALYGQAFIAHYVAWDVDNNAPALADAANHTIRLVRDGAAAAATNAPVDVENGVCSLLLTAAEMTAECVTIQGVSATPDVVILPLTVVPDADYTKARAEFLDAPVSGLATSLAVTAIGNLVVALMGDGWTDETLVALRAAQVTLQAAVDAVPTAAANAAAVVAAAFGDGEFPVPLTVEDDSGDPVPAARLTIPGLSVQSSETDGTFASAWGLDPGTYAVTIMAPAGYTPANPYTLVVAADGSVTTPTDGAFVVPKAATPEPTPDGYCTVWCLAGTEGPDDTTGTFYVSEVFSPEVYDPDGTPVEIVRGGTSMALVDGAAYRQVRQGAVVSFVLATPGKQKTWTRVVIPETAEAYVQNLVAEE